MASALKFITSRAKQIYAKGGTWKGAIKKAGAEYRGKKKSTPKKTAKRSSVKKTAPRKKSARSTTRKKSAPRKHATVASYTNKAKAMLIDNIGDLEARKFKAVKVRDKKKIGKRISELKTKYRKLN